MSSLVGRRASERDQLRRRQQESTTRHKAPSPGRPPGCAHPDEAVGSKSPTPRPISHQGSACQPCQPPTTRTYITHPQRPAHPAPSTHTSRQNRARNDNQPHTHAQILQTHPPAHLPLVCYLGPRSFCHLFAGCSFTFSRRIHFRGHSRVQEHTRKTGGRGKERSEKQEAKK